MQQALYKIIAPGLTAPTSAIWVPAPSARRTSLVRPLARHWDLYGVLALMGSSAAYGLYALSHLA